MLTCALLQHAVKRMSVAQQAVQAEQMLMAEHDAAFAVKQLKTELSVHSAEAAEQVCSSMGIRVRGHVHHVPVRLAWTSHIAHLLMPTVPVASGHWSYQLCWVSRHFNVCGFAGFRAHTGSACLC